jgi:hypothetical protein
MEQNISLYIGDNASGKTRLLKKIIKDAMNKNETVITNIGMYNGTDCLVDNNKLQLLIDSNNELVDRIMENNLATYYDVHVSNLLKLLYAQGDILVLDELDASLKRQDVIDISAAISDVRSLWKEIHINGYNMELLRLFTDIDREDYTENYTENIYFVSNEEVRKLAEDEVCDAFDTIRQ